MARIRSVKPELRTDLTVAEWPREVRYAWVLLLGYLDDYGRGRDDSRLVVADLFPLDRDVTEKKINAWLDRMAKSGPLCRYTVDGQGFMHAVKWGNHQRISHPTESRLPPCPIHDLHEAFQGDTGAAPESLRNDSGDPPEPFRPSRAPAEQGAGSREQVDKGTGSVDTTAQTITAEWMERTPKRPPGQVVGHVSKLVAQMLAEGIDPNDVRRGLAAWMSKGLHPSTLPSVVNEVMNAPASAADRAVAMGLTLVEQLQREERGLPA